MTDLESANELLGTRWVPTKGSREYTVSWVGESNKSPGIRVGCKSAPHRKPRFYNIESFLKSYRRVD